jgi:curli biogenesis system outer membrane secretion channel CsgG
MLIQHSHFIRGFSAVAICLLAAGCALVSSEGRPRGAVQDIGHYSAPPPDAARPRVAVPALRVTTGEGFAKSLDLGTIASDESTKLLTETGRFNLVEGSRLGQLLDDGQLSQVIAPGELLRPVRIPGVRYVLVGRVLNLSVHAEDPAEGFGVAKMRTWAGMDQNVNKRAALTVAASVNLRLVDPASGVAMAEVAREFRQTATAATFGIDLAQRNLASLELGRDQAAGLLRLALDDAVRQMLPQVDQLAQNDPSAPPAGGHEPPPMVQVTGSHPTTRPAGLRRICQECGADISGYDEFCPNCGAKLK